MGPSDIAMLCVLLVLFLLYAFFSSSETALTTFNMMRIRMLVDDGNKRAIILDKVIKHQSKMLSTVLIGNNIVNIGASAISTLFVQNVFGNIYVSIGTFVLTFVVLIFGEIIPKTVAGIHSENVALSYARVISILMFVLTPIIFIIDNFSKLILMILRVDTSSKSSHFTEDELRPIMDVSQEEGIIESEELDMINNVFDFGDARAKDIMVPKVDISMISTTTTYDELLDLVKRDKFTRIPVYKDSTDNIIGVINIKDMIINHVTKDNFKLEELMREPYYTYAQKELNNLLIEMRDNDTSLCIVLDEYGLAEGLITLEDIIEEIVGEIRDEFDEDEKRVIRKINENQYIVEGSINLDDLNDQLGLDIDSEHYESIGGLIIENLERLPDIGDSVTIGNCTLKVEKMDDKRIDSVRITIHPIKKDNPDEQEQ